MTARTPGPHVCERHEPGTYACYHRCGCPCEPCRCAARRYEKRADHLRATGAIPRLDADPVRAHVEALLAAGMGRAEVCRLAEVEHYALTRLLRGDSAALRRDRAARLLAVTPPPIAQQQTGRVDTCGTIRRLDALALLGWSAADVAREAGLLPANVRGFRRRRCVYAATRAGIAAVYDDLWSTPAPDSPTAARTRSTARKRGAVPALAWDDGAGPHGIDNPSATPHPWTAEAPKRQGSPATFEVDDLAFMADGGDSMEAAMQRLGVTASGIHHRLTRAGRGDILTRLYANRERRVA